GEERGSANRREVLTLGAELHVVVLDVEEPVRAQRHFDAGSDGPADERVRDIRRRKAERSGEHRTWTAERWSTAVNRQPVLLARPGGAEFGIEKPVVSCEADGRRRRSGPLGGNRVGFGGHQRHNGEESGKIERTVRGGAAAVEPRPGQVEVAAHNHPSDLVHPAALQAAEERAAARIGGCGGGAGPSERTEEATIAEYRSGARVDERRPFPTAAPGAA